MWKVFSPFTIDRFEGLWNKFLNKAQYFKILRSKSLLPYQTCKIVAIHCEMGYTRLMKGCDRHIFDLLLNFEYVKFISDQF